MRPAVRRALMTAALTVGVTLVCATGAYAVSGTPINVGTPYEINALQDAVDSSGTAYIVWANSKDLPPTTTNVVQYCVIHPGAKSCAYSGTLTPADSASAVDNAQVLVDGSTVVILADVYGAAGTDAADYEPEQEWQSTDGGASFTIVNGGLSVADGTLSADTEPLSAVVVPGTGTLGYGWDSAASFVPNTGAPPTFDEFPLSSPPECSDNTCPAAESYSVLEPDTNPDQVSNGGGQYASQTGTNPGVLGIFNTNFTNGPLGCSTGEGFAYAYGSGDQSAANDYDATSTGQGAAGSAWKVLTALGDCNVDEAAIAGGPSGFGVLEDDTAHHNVVYQRFDQSHENFDTAYNTVAGSDSETQPAVSQDGAGGVYATFINGNGGDPISLAYSSNGGTSWAGPATLDSNSDGSANDLTSSVGSNGQGWATWLDNGSIMAQQFDAADVAVPASVSKSATATSKTVTVTVSCASTPCTVTITITVDPPATMASAVRVADKKGKKKAKPKTITLGSGRFTIRSKGSKKLTFNLSKAGRTFLASRHGHVKAGAKVTEKFDGRSLLTKQTVTLTLVKARTHKRKK